MLNFSKNELNLTKEQTEQVLRHFWQYIQELNERELKLRKRVEVLEVVSMPKSFDTEGFKAESIQRLLGISESTFKRWVKSGKILRVKRGLYKPSDDLGLTIFSYDGVDRLMLPASSIHLLKKRFGSEVGNF